MAERVALVTGAGGNIGAAATAALLAHGWRVRALTRRPDDPRLAREVGLEWVRGDAMSAADVAAAAEGARILVHGLNPPNYRNWRGLAIPMLRHAIAATRASGARLIFPGNVYVFGPDAWPVTSEDSPQRPRTRKGAIRVEMERMLRDAAGEGVRSLVLRAGDFFGAGGRSSFFASVMVKLGRPVRAITDPATPGVGHAWAYLPDLGETLALLADREETLDAAAVLHFGGHWLEDGAEMARAIRRVVDNPDLPIRRFPWIAVYLGAPFVPLFRELIEMRYLWRVPLRLDNRKLVGLLGSEPHTPLDEAVRRTLQGLGCLPAPSGG